MELPPDAVFSVDGTMYQVKRAPKRFWPCQSCAFLEKCESPEFFHKLPRCRKDVRTDKTPIIYVEVQPNEAQ